MNRFLQMLFASLLVSLLAQTSFAQHEDRLKKDIERVELLLKLFPIENQTIEAIMDSLGDYLFTEEKDLGFGGKRVFINKNCDYLYISVTVILYQDAFAYYEIIIGNHPSLGNSSRSHIEKAWLENGGPEYEVDNSKLIYRNTIAPVLAAFHSAVGKELGEMNQVTVKSEDKEFYEYLISPLNNITVGSICGVIGAAPIGKQLIESLIKRKRTEIIENILRGYNPEGRVYAAIALLQMKEQAEQLNAETEQAIHKIMSLDTPISTCEGRNKVERKTAALILALFRKD